MIDKWNEDNPGPRLHATMVEPALSIDAEHSQEVAAEQARSCAYDVLELDTPRTAEFAERGFVEPVKGAWMDDPGDFFPRVMETVQWRGHQYAVPWTTDAGLLYLRGKPAPASWDKLLHDGYETQLKDYEGLTVNALEVVWNTTRQLVLSGPVDKIDIATAKVILAGLNRLATAAEAGALHDSLEWDEPASANAFVAKQTSIMRNWPYEFRALSADTRIRRAAFEFHQLPEPSYSVLGGQNLAVSRYSKHKDQAGKLIKSLTGKVAEKRIYCGGYPPTRKSTLSRDAPCSATKDLDQGATPTPKRLKQFTETLKGALQKARPRPATPYYEQFSETFRECVNMVLKNNAPSPEKLADALNAALKGRQGSCGGQT
jgi:multiple sugar transport system substrate-binding protein